jgi:hypothetical protein
MKFTFALLALAASTLVATGAWADANTSPGRNMAAASATGLNLGGGGQSLSVDLKGARRKKLLVVHAFAQQDTGPTTSQTVTLVVDANGVTLEPDTMSARCERGICGASGTLFLDLAAAEAAHPGVFYNTLPLTITLTGLSNASGFSGKLTMVAELRTK